MNPEILRTLEDFERRGENLHARISEALRQANVAHRQRKMTIGLISKGIPRGGRALGREFIDRVSDDRQQERIASEANAMADSWLASVTTYLAGVSRLTGSVTRRGNSATLVRSFNSAKTAAKADTKIRRGLTAIQRLKTYELVYTRDLDSILTERKGKGKKPEDAVRKDIQRLLARYPSEKAALLGALDALEAGGADSYRQCLSSCRNCLENLVRRMSGENDWRQGLTVLVESDSARRTVKTAYGYLSGRGTHGQDIPTREEAQAGFEQTLAAVRLVLAGGKGQSRG